MSLLAVLRIAFSLSIGIFRHCIAAMVEFAKAWNGCPTSFDRSYGGDCTGSNTTFEGLASKRGSVRI